MLNNDQAMLQERHIYVGQAKNSLDRKFTHVQRREPVPFCPICFSSIPSFSGNRACTNLEIQLSVLSVIPHNKLSMLQTMAGFVHQLYHDA